MTDKSAPLQLDVWKGDWGLPSVDLDCLRFMTYIKFAGLEFEVNATSNPFWTPNGKLPVLRLKSKKITAYHDLEQFALSRDSNPDHGLSKKQVAETIAFTSMLEEKLFPALQYLWWVDRANVNNVTRPWYSKAIPFPYNFYYPNTYCRKGQEMITALFEYLEEEQDIEAKVYGDAQKCLNNLSLRLGESDFMFGTHPTSIDATLFAYLAPLLKAPLKSTVLQNHLKACTNLYKFVTRVNQRYFTKDFNEYENKRKEDLKAQQAKDTDFPNKTRNKVLAALFAALAMFSYALHVGLVESHDEDSTSFIGDDLQDDLKEDEN